MTTTAIKSTTAILSTSTNVTSSTDLCFLCRFDFGFTFSDLDPGVVGLTIILTSLCCCCVCYSMCMFCCFFSNKQTQAYSPIVTTETPKG